MIVSATWLKARLSDPMLRVIDVRSYHGEPDRGRQEYELAHVPGASYLDLETDLAGPGGGRHPLPPIDTFIRKLESNGISRDSTVIVYDQDHGATAARLWWMLRHVGHEDVAVLDGGWPAWIESDGPQTAITSEPETASYRAEVRTDDFVTREVVAARPSQVTLIDARAPARFRGESEPIDPVAGRIPGAINIPHDSLAKGGKMLALDGLVDRIPNDPEAMAYCGSGVTACYVILASSVAGISAPRLYVGSFSDWIEADLPVARD